VLLLLLEMLLIDMAISLLGVVPAEAAFRRPRGAGVQETADFGAPQSAVAVCDAKDASAGPAAMPRRTTAWRLNDVKGRAEASTPEPVQCSMLCGT
jgi:hypothetical protein